MRHRIYYCLVVCVLFGGTSIHGQDTLRLSLNQAIDLAQKQSVDAAVALNELKTAYWEYRTHIAEQLPEVNFSGTLPSYMKRYIKYQQSDGSYTFVQDNVLGLNGVFSIEQNVALTGGKLSLKTSLDFNRQLGSRIYNEYMSVPISLTFVQPVFGVNRLKWHRRIEPVRYQEVKARYIEQVEQVTIGVIARFFSLLLARENMTIAMQNLHNAEKLYEVAVAKRQIGHISESELMQLRLSALQMKALLTEAQSDLNANRFRLSAFLGLEGQEVIEPEIPDSAPGFRMMYEEVLAKAQENNAFSRNIRRRKLEADYEVAVAKGNRRTVDLFASIGYTGKDQVLRSAYSHLNGNQMVEVGVKIPILDWGKRRGKVKVAESNREVIHSRIQREQMEFVQDLFLLVENFNNQAGQLEIAKEADWIAERRYRTSIETFMIGKISVLDLNDARRSKDEAKQKHIQELYRYWDFYYKIRIVALYDFVENRTLDADFERIIR